MDDIAPVPIVPSSKPEYFFDENATYLISGGLGGVGRSIFQWMVDLKAKSFLLLSRSGAKGQAAQESLAKMAERNVNIAGPPCYISCEATVTKVLETYSLTMPPIKGCIQAAMVLKQASIKPEVQGSWNLMLSFIASITGSPISLNLGPILSVGITAEKSLVESLAASGFEGIQEREMLALLDWACDPELPIPNSPARHQVITGLGGARTRCIAHGDEVYWMLRPLFSVLRNETAEPGPSAAAAGRTGDHVPGIAALLSATTGPEERQEVIVQALVRKLSRALNIPAEDIEPGKPIYAFGVDSLVALEIRYWFMKEMKANVAVFDIMGSASLRVLAEIVETKSECCPKRAGDGEAGR
ncbi:hypothetical protein MMC17_007410 [Xylographa soralifera]|nr:hypothetical protein [Xylographa soralifera]